MYMKTILNVKQFVFQVISYFKYVQYFIPIENQLFLFLIHRSSIIENNQEGNGLVARTQ